LSKVNLSKRLKSLQGLRGVAALTVTVSHFLAAFYLTGKDAGTILESLRPISHLFGILAHKAVWIFFVLSGFVLTLQLDSRHHTYLRYLGSRLVRLYFPVWFAIILNLAVISAIAQSGKQIDFWIGPNPEGITALGLAYEFLLISESYFLGPLWSLRWEVIFSVIAFSAWRTGFFKSNPVITIVISSLLSMVGEYLANGWIKYLPMFLVGVALYFLYKQKWLKAESRLSPISEFGILALAVFVPVAGFVVTSFTDGGIENLRYILDVPLSLTSISLVFFALSKGSLLEQVLSLKWLQSLGDFSFSLYLVHAPILLLGLYLSDFNVLVGLICLMLTIPFSYFSFIFIEKPVQRLSRSIRVSSSAKGSR
jgi:peptidoglycan/LPS O-acetylase OafA/YrhL